MQLNFKITLLFLTLFFATIAKTQPQEPMDYDALKQEILAMALSLYKSIPVSLPATGINWFLDTVTPDSTETINEQQLDNPLLPILILGYLDLFVSDYCWKTYNGKSFTLKCMARYLVNLLATNPFNTTLQALYLLGYREPIRDFLWKNDEWVTEKTNDWWWIFRKTASIGQSGKYVPLTDKIISLALTNNVCNDYMAHKNRRRA